VLIARIEENWKKLWRLFRIWKEISRNSVPQIPEQKQIGISRKQKKNYLHEKKN
jgi:hypothetical protein